MNRFVTVAFFVVIPFLFSSCTSKIFGGKKSKGKHTKQAQAIADTVNTQPAPAVTGIPVATANPKDVLISSLMPLWKKRFKYKTFSGKAKISFEGPDGTVGFSANFRVAKDSLVWVHVTALGGLYPVARILVTPDSFFMINYDQKQVTFLPLASATKVLPVAVKFSQIQSLFTGEPLAEGNIINAEVKDSTWTLRTEGEDYLQHVTYQKMDSVMTFGQLQARKANGPTAMVDYTNYENVAGRKLSTSRMVHIQNGVNNYTLDMNFVNPEFDKPLEFPFSMPKNFTVKNQ